MVAVSASTSRRFDHGLTTIFGHGLTRAVQVNLDTMGREAALDLIDGEDRPAAIVVRSSVPSSVCLMQCRA